MGESQRPNSLSSANTDDISWDSQEMDCDNARATTLTGAKAIPDGYEVDPVQHMLIAGPDPIGITFASSLRKPDRDWSGSRDPRQIGHRLNHPRLLGSS